MLTMWSCSVLGTLVSPPEIFIVSLKRVVGFVFIPNTSFSPYRIMPLQNRVLFTFPSGPRIQPSSLFTAERVSRTYRNDRDRKIVTRHEYGSFICLPPVFYTQGILRRENAVNSSGEFVFREMIAGTRSTKAVRAPYGLVGILWGYFSRSSRSDFAPSRAYRCSGFSYARFTTYGEYLQSGPRRDV